MNKKRRPTPRPSPLLRGLLEMNPARSENYRAALKGDALAMCWLRKHTPCREDRFQLAVDMCRDGAHKPTFRQFLLECLIDNPYRMRPSVVGGRAILYWLIEYAEFKHDPDIPPKLILYRGTHSVSLDLARIGYFWTPDASYAATYADGPEPILLRAEVQTCDVAAFYSPLKTLFPISHALDPNFLSEKTRSWEAVLMKPPERVTAESISTWRQAA